MDDQEYLLNGYEYISLGSMLFRRRLKTNKTLVIIGYRPGKKKTIKERSVILIEKQTGLTKNDYAFEIPGKLSDDMFVNQ